MKVVWTIAGFDPSSGAGVTADLLTFAAHGLFGCSAITAYTVQSTLGVAAVEPQRPALLHETLHHLLADLPPAGIKIGMLGTPEAAEVVGAFLAHRAARAGLQTVPVVLDPVLRSSSGHALYPLSALSLLRERLLPVVDWITPNWGELALLAESPVASLDGARAAARALQRRYPHLNLAVTGGDQPTPTELVMTEAGQEFLIAGEHVATSSTHGTGCAFSSALLCRLVQGATAERAVEQAKEYVAGALRHAPGLGHGKGPMALLWPLSAAGDWQEPDD